jgi:hypothetical protein
MKTRHVVLTLALVIAAAIAAFADRTPRGTIVEAVSPRAASRITAQQSVKPVAILANQSIQRLLPRDALNEADVKLARPLENSPFESKSWTPLPTPQPPAPPVVSVAPPPPTAPPLPFIFLGKSVSADGFEVFLARGESTFVVNKSTVIEGTYRVDSIAPPLLSLTYLPLNQVQQLNIGVFD